MFDETGCTFSPDGHLDAETDKHSDLRRILSASKELPAAVVAADFTYVEERVIDKAILETLVGDPAYGSDAPDWVLRRKRRMLALSKYLDQFLICVFIRLPGIHYTIEIDPALGRIAYCEWQVA